MTLSTEKETCEAYTFGSLRVFFVVFAQIMLNYFQICFAMSTQKTVMSMVMYRKQKLSETYNFILLIKKM